MLSSTSNSNDRIPKARWDNIWLKAILIVISAVIVWNINWARQEVYPAPRNSYQLWWEQRDRLKPNDENSIVLLGSSRMLAGIDQTVFTEKLGIVPAQLAFEDRSPSVTLNYFANDPKFKGIVIAEVSAPILSDSLDREPVSKDRGEVPENIYTSQFYSDNWKQVKSYLIATPNIGENFPEMLLNTFNPKAAKKYSNMMFDRSTPYYREYLSDRRNKKVLDRNIEAVLNLTRENPNRRESFLKRTQNMEESVRRIQERGGKVIFVNFPISGKLRTVYEKTFPRKQYWEVFAAKTSARTIHYADYPSLSKFECVDDSHIAAEDSKDFTQNLIKILFKSKQ